MKNKYDELLQEFCDTSNIRFAVPFCGDKHVYATNGHTAIRVKSHLPYETYFGNKALSSTLETIYESRNCNDVVDMDLIKDFLGKQKKVNACEQCEACGGSGEVTCSACGNDHECNACQGTGDGNAIDGKFRYLGNQSLQVGNSKFTAATLAKLVKAYDELPGFSVRLLHSDTMRASVFENDVWEVVLMPTML